MAADINGGRGFILRDGATTAAAVTFAYDDLGMATDIFIVRNPDKLSHLGGSPLH
jgi:RNA polymerase sigma-70 factor (ECF subfamily)